MRIMEKSERQCRRFGAASEYADGAHGCTSGRRQAAVAAEVGLRVSSFAGFINPRVDGQVTEHRLQNVGVVAVTLKEGVAS